MPATHSHSLQPIRIVVDYFADPRAVPIIVQQFTPDKGWTRYAFRKRVSRAWARKLSREGITSVALEHDGRIADFRIAELLSGR